MLYEMPLILESCFFVMLFKHKKKSFWSRWFKTRDLIFREQDKITFLSLSVRQQKCLFLIFVLLVGWTFFTSFYYIKYETVAARKSDELKRTQSEYAGLKGELHAFSDHLDKMIARIDDNQSAIYQLKEVLLSSEPKIRKTAEERISADGVEKEKSVELLQEETAVLKEEARLIREKLLSFDDDNDREKTDSFSYHEVLLQRDIAVAEMNALQEKVKGLENLISGMQDAQILTFRKMAFLANDSISLIEDGLSDVKQSLAKSGIEMETLLRRIRHNKENVGIGGPFIPMPMPKPQHDLNIFLVSLNQRLDRWYDLTSLQNSLPLGKPVDRIRTTSVFGTRVDPFQGGPARHEAVDIGGMIGEPIYATAPGKVVRAGSWGWYGNMIEIDHGLGFRTRYAHMEKIFVTKGETVRVGDQIGTIGNTGRSTGPHLHYEIRVRGVAVDPMKFIKARDNVFKS